VKIPWQNWQPPFENQPFICFQGCSVLWHFPVHWHHFHRVLNWDGPNHACIFINTPDIVSSIVVQVRLGDEEAVLFHNIWDNPYYYGIHVCFNVTLQLCTWFINRGINARWGTIKWKALPLICTKSKTFNLTAISISGTFIMESFITRSYRYGH